MRRDMMPPVPKRLSPTEGHKQHRNGPPLGRHARRIHGAGRTRRDHHVDHPARRAVRVVAGAGLAADRDHGRVLPRPLDAAPVHDADDAHSRAEPDRRYDARVQEPDHRAVADAQDHDAGDGGGRAVRRLRRLSELGPLDRAVAAHRHSFRARSGKERHGH